MKFILLALSLLFFVACARQQPAQFPPEGCAQAYTILPGNFVIDLAAGSEVMLNASAQEFVLYCNEKDARQALQLAKKQGQISDESDWRIYLLAEPMEQIGKLCHEEDLCLAGHATVTDWLEHEQ